MSHTAPVPLDCVVCMNPSRATRGLRARLTLDLVVRMNPSLTLVSAAPRLPQAKADFAGRGDESDLGSLFHTLKRIAGLDGDESGPKKSRGINVSDNAKRTAAAAAADNFVFWGAGVRRDEKDAARFQGAAMPGWGTQVRFAAQRVHL